MSAADSSKDSFFNLNSTDVRDDVIQEFEDEPGAMKDSWDDLDDRDDESDSVGSIIKASFLFLHLERLLIGCEVTVFFEFTITDNYQQTELACWSQNQINNHFRASRC